MNDLLPECNELIFKNLNFDDLIRIRLVSKQFKYYADNSNSINRLFIGKYSTHYQSWPSKELINECDVISLKCFKKLRSLSLFNLDINLKCLIINQIGNCFNFKELSNLNNLEYLDISASRFINNQTIDLSNLRHLVLFSNGSCKLNLNTPRLGRIEGSFDILNLNFIFPETIKYIGSNKYEDKLRIFQNLEVMVLNLDENGNLDKNLLSIFKNLKKLKINASYDYIDLHKRIKHNLIKILQEKIDLNRDIDIYIQRIKLINMYQLKKIDTYKDIMEFQMANINLMDLNEIKFLNYNDLENFCKDIKNDLTACFFEKSSCLIEIFVTENIKNNHNFIWFLRSLKNLKNLITFVKLDQYVYDNLPDKIEKLEFKNLEHSFNLKSDDQDLFSLAFELFLKSKSLNKFNFYYFMKRIEISKDDDGFGLRINSKMIKNKVNYNELIELCIQFKLKSDLSLLSLL